MMRARRWAWVAIGMAVLGAACGGSGSGDVGVDDLVIRVDAGRDVAADTGDAADVAAGDPGLVRDGAVEADPGALPDPGVEEDPGFDPGPPPCDVGLDLCMGTPGDGKTAATAIVIGRIHGALGSPLTVNPDTSQTGNGDDLDDGCWDGGNDVYYKVYMRPGELLNVQMMHASGIDMVLKAYRGTACASDPSSLVTCVDTTSACGENRCGNLQLNADVEGWYTIVLDGETYEDQGKHRLDFYLMNCADANCCCPY